MIEIDYDNFSLWPDESNDTGQTEEKLNDTSNNEDTDDTYSDNNADVDSGNTNANNNNNNATFDLWSKEEEIKRKYAFKAMIDKMLKAKTKDPNVVLKWIKDGRPIAAASANSLYAKNISDYLFASETSFLQKRKGGRTHFCVRNVNTDALTMAVEKAKYELQKTTIVYDYRYFSELVKKDAALKNKDLIHLSGLSQVEAEVMRRELAAHGRGSRFSMSRMTDGTWMLAFKSEDVAKEVSKKERYKTESILAAYTAAMFTSNGPQAEQNNKRIDAEIKIERKAIDQFSRLIQDGKKAVYLYDSVAPNKYVKLEKEQVSVYSVKNPGSTNAMAEFEVSYPQDDVMAEETYMSNVMSFEHLAYARSEKDMERIIQDPKALANRKEAYAEIEKQEGTLRTLSMKLADSFVNKNIDAQYFVEPEQRGNIFSEYAKYLQDVITEIATRQPAEISDKQIQDIAKYVQRNNIDISEYQYAAQKIQRQETVLRAPQEKRLVIKKELDRIQKEMRYDANAFGKEISEARDDWNQQQKQHREEEEVD